MFEGLIEFIEQSVFTLINQITSTGPLDAAADASEPKPDDENAIVDPSVGRRQAQRILTMLLQFAEKNPGMTRVMVGDALVFENERLQLRMNQFFDKIEASLRQCLRQPAGVNGSATPSVDAQVRASMLTSFVLGRLQRFARSGFKRWPTEHLDASLALLI
jgi:TetR/AcrR family transcriptional regulator